MIDANTYEPIDTPDTIDLKPALKFVKEEVNGEIIYRLNEGTDYLPALYIQHNKNWDSWMVFDCLNKIPITNRIFKTREDCVDYISSYDSLSENALASLYSEIKEPNLARVTKAISFSHPTTLAQVISTDLRNIISAQKQKILHLYNKKLLDNADNIQLELVYTFFDGLLSLFFTKNSDNSGDITFFIFNNGSVIDYPAWKTVSVAMALFSQLIDYDKEQTKQNKLERWRDSFVGKTLIDSNGVGLSFGKHIENTNLILMQKVQVNDIDGKMCADKTQPLTPFFIGELSESKKGVLLEVRSVNKHISIMDETFIIE